MAFELTQVQSMTSNTPQSNPSGTFAYPKLNRMGMQAVIDFYLLTLSEGLAYQVRASPEKG